jgi:hypothetical protein
MLASLDKCAYVTMEEEVASLSLERLDRSRDSTRKGRHFLLQEKTRFPLCRITTQAAGITLEVDKFSSLPYTSINQTELCRSSVDHAPYNASGAHHPSYSCRIFSPLLSSHALFSMKANHHTIVITIHTLELHGDRSPLLLMLNNIFI